MAKSSKSGLAARLGTQGRKAHEEAKNKETTYSGGGELPDGIEGGIAELVECKFDTYKKGENKGEYFFYAAGVVHRPKTFKGRKVEGKRTSIMEPIHDTPSRKRATVNDHLDWVYNELRKLGVDTSEIKDLDHLEKEIIPALKEAAPFFSFRTWKGEPTKEYPNPRLNEIWEGLVEYDEEDEDDVEEDGDDEEEAVAEEDIEDVEEEEETEEAEEETEEEEEAEEDSEEVDYESLGTLADEGDEEAGATLETAAEEAGLDPDSYETWAGLAAALMEGTDEEEEPEEDEEEEDEETEEEEADEEEEEWEPEAKDVYLYKPISPKTKKRLKAVECEVVKVTKSNRTVTLKNLDTGKTILGANKKPLSVAWTELAELA